MEARAPYGLPKGPRNLAQELAAWLRTQGFTATTQQLGPLVSVAAHWLSPQGERFELDYAWQSGPHAEATCRLQVRRAGQLSADPLFTAQHVRRLQEARLLVNNCVRLANARLLVTLPHPAL